MAAPNEADVNLTVHYIELNKLGNKGDFAKAIKVAKKSEFCTFVYNLFIYNIELTVRFKWNVLHLVLTSGYFLFHFSTMVFLVLQLAPNELNAQRCLVISYIQESDFKNGLATINKYPPSLSE